MEDYIHENIDASEQRASRISSAIQGSFPVFLFNQDDLEALLNGTSKPRVKGNRVLNVFRRIFAFPYIDDEVREFLELLRDQNWAQINWNRHWMVIPILPNSIFAYCLPGIMQWFCNDDCESNDSIEEGFISHNLAHIILYPSLEESEVHNFTPDQKLVIVEAVSLLLDDYLAGNSQPASKHQLQTIAHQIMQVLMEGGGNLKV